MKNYDYVIFDFDGTVVDTGEGILKSLQYSFEQMGHEVPDLSDLKKFIGPPIHYSYVTFYGVSEDEVEEYIKKYRERYREIGIYECFVYDGVIETIKTLREKGVMDYLKITEYFDAIVGTKFDDSNHPGKTDLVLESMKKLSDEDKKHTLMVGDRYFDIDGAAGAGVDSVGVTYGYGSREEFKEHGATYIIDNAKELLKIIGE